jgi:hypothetical protein
MADPEDALLLVRGVLAAADQARALTLDIKTQRLALITPGDQVGGLECDREPIVSPSASRTA